MCTLNSFTEVDILYFGCMEFKSLFDFHKKVKILSCYFEKNLNAPLSFTPGKNKAIYSLLFTLKKCLPRCILHRPCYTVNFSSSLTITIYELKYEVARQIYIYVSLPVTAMNTGRQGYLLYVSCALPCLF